MLRKLLDRKKPWPCWTEAWSLLTLLSLGMQTNDRREPGWSRNQQGVVLGVGVGWMPQYPSCLWFFFLLFLKWGPQLAPSQLHWAAPSPEPSGIPTSTNDTHLSPTVPATRSRPRLALINPRHCLPTETPASPAHPIPSRPTGSPDSSSKKPPLVPPPAAFFFLRASL